MSTARLVGEFLRARRGQIRPEDLGLPRGARRRVPGLRREEAAQRCGISPTWYTWIEQGRAADVSVETLHAISRGLELSRAEHAYLLEFASRADPLPVEPREAALEPLETLDTLVRAVRTPAYLLDRHWDAVAWNRPAAELFAGWLGARPREERRRSGAPVSHAGRNLLRYVFLDDAARRFIAGWNERARRLAAEYRADSASWRDDPVHRRLIEELCSASPVFEAAWRSQEVQSRDDGVRTFNHPRHGACRYDHFTLHVAQRAGLKLTVLVPQTGAAPR